MIDRILEQPGAFVAFAVIIAALWLAAGLRVRRDRLRKHRARVQRRNALRSQRDRRWLRRD